MTIKAGDRIRFNLTHFEPELVPVIFEVPVAKVMTVETGYGTYEEYITVLGDSVSELQLVD